MLFFSFIFYFGFCIWIFENFVVLQTINKLKVWLILFLLNTLWFYVTFNHGYSYYEHCNLWIFGNAMTCAGSRNCRLYQEGPEFSYLIRYKVVVQTSALVLRYASNCFGDLAIDCFHFTIQILQIESFISGFTMLKQAFNIISILLRMETRLHVIKFNGQITKISIFAKKNHD